MWTPFVHDIHLSGNFVDVDFAVNAGTNTSISGTTLIRNKTLPPAAQEIIARAGPRQNVR